MTVSDVNYEMYASTAVDTDKITDTIALASAAKAFKEDKASQYQKSLDFLEAMVSCQLNSEILVRTGLNK